MGWAQGAVRRMSHIFGHTFGETFSRAFGRNNPRGRHRASDLTSHRTSGRTQGQEKGPATGVATGLAPGRSRHRATGQASPPVSGAPVPSGLLADRFAPAELVARVRDVLGDVLGDALGAVRGWPVAVRERVGAARAGAVVNRSPNDQAGDQTSDQSGDQADDDLSDRSSDAPSYESHHAAQPDTSDGVKDAPSTGTAKVRGTSGAKAGQSALGEVGRLAARVGKTAWDWAVVIWRHTLRASAWALRVGARGVRWAWPHVVARRALHVGVLAALAGLVLVFGAAHNLAQLAVDADGGNGWSWWRLVMAFGLLAVGFGLYVALWAPRKSGVRSSAGDEDPSGFVGVSRPASDASSDRSSDAFSGTSQGVSPGLSSGERRAAARPAQIAGSQINGSPINGSQTTGGEAAHATPNLRSAHTAHATPTEPSGGDSEVEPS